MKILVTGSNGFIGKNLLCALNNKGYTDVVTFDREQSLDELESICRSVDFIFHLAGVNRPEHEEDFTVGNVDLTAEIVNFLMKHQNHCPLMIASSLQATLPNPYGMSKKACEDLVFEYGDKTGARVLVYRFPNVFGKWCRPNYNSAVATFCYNIARDIPIKVNDPEVELKLVYIDDLVEELIHGLGEKETRSGEFCVVLPVAHVKLGDIAGLITAFRDTRTNLHIPSSQNAFEKKLYSTYLSYLPEDGFSYPLHMNADHRGSFTEFIRTETHGQISVNISKPGITKGNHWHQSKNEKFLVVSGYGVIRFRKIDADKILEYYVDGKKLEVIDIPPGYTHNILNLGETDMVTLMWANECFDAEKPDTYFLEV